MHAMSSFKVGGMYAEVECMLIVQVLVGVLLCNCHGEFLCSFFLLCFLQLKVWSPNLSCVVD